MYYKGISFYKKASIPSGNINYSNSDIILIWLWNIKSSTFPKIFMPLSKLAPVKYLYAPNRKLLPNPNEINPWIIIYHGITTS